MPVFKQTTTRKRVTTMVAALLAMLAPVGAAQAQVQTVDPDAAIDGDLNGGNTGFDNQSQIPAQPTTTMQSPVDPEGYDSAGNGMPVESGNGTTAYPAQQQGYDTVAPATGTGSPAATDSSTTYHEDDLIGAAEGVFGKGAQGLADLIRDLLKKQGEPNGYIVGREAGGAFAVGLRYGSGTLFHKVEGERPVYWTGPSIGFDAGANAASTFVLVYNLYDTNDLYKRFGAGEGQAYLIGGFNVSYLRRGDTVLIPVRAGAGLRLGANIGYMKFTEKQSWLPF